MARGIKLKWKKLAFDVARATWRKYDLRVVVYNFKWSYEIRTKREGMIVGFDNGYPSVEAAQVAAELAARRIWEAR